MREREKNRNGIQVVCQETKDEQSRSKKREGKSKVEGNREDRMSKFGEEASRRQGEIVISGTG